jgi:mannose-6-phosphate isomerase-like protein (cupin superfamily)
MKMKASYYKNQKEGLDAVTKNDKTYQLVKHSLKAGEEIRFHLHKKAREWIIIEAGTLTIKFVYRKILKEYVLLVGKNTAVVIYFPKKQPHYLEAHEDLKYYVVRDRKDVSTPCKVVFKKKTNLAGYNPVRGG